MGMANESGLNHLHNNFLFSDVLSFGCGETASQINF